MTTFADIEKQARTMAAADRARLAEIMLESLQEFSSREAEMAWETEIAERVAAYEQGKVKTYSAKDVFAEARQTRR